MADCLRVIGENTAKLSLGAYMNMRWSDILHPPEKPKEEEKGKITERIRQKMR